ncbi:S-adenosyl-L-methionine-dependent methyltransferase, partial [Pavlovales sp. CCMP2436]
VPHRLRSKPTELIETVNDWHFAMINDQPRNRFYQTLLREVITPDSVVLEIGAGSGLLSIMAAKAGAKKVIAIEANREMATLATQIIAANGMSDRIEVINRMSTDVHLHDLSAVPTILVSEILGTLLLGESALHYVQDARARLVTPGAAILPKLGTQYVTLIESEEVHRITAVCSWEDIDLRHFNALQDTTSLVFTKQYGFRFSSCPHRFLSGKLPVLKIDFACAQTETAFPEEQRVRFQATATGQAHAVLASWDVSDGARKEVMSTHPDDTIDNFPRDMQWGQALQLLEDSEGLHQPQPTPLMVFFFFFFADTVEAFFLLF